MRGGRNKFGPIYRRDRALRRQIRSQLQNDPDLDAIAKAAATATLARNDVEATAATLSKSAGGDGLQTYDFVVSRPANTELADVDLKPDVAELCGLAAGRDGASSLNYTSTRLQGSAEIPTTGLPSSVVHSSYVCPVTVAAVSRASTSDPLSGLSGMAAALLSQFLAQKRVSMPQTQTNLTAASSCVPHVLQRSSTTTAVSTQVLATPSSQRHWGETPAPPHANVQYFNSRLTATSQPATAEKSAVPMSHPVLPQRYVIPVIQTLSSPVTPQQSLIPPVRSVFHPVTPQQSVVSAAVHAVSHPVTPVNPVVHTVSHPVTPVNPVVRTVSNPVTIQQVVISAVSHPVTPQRSTIPAVHTVSQPVTPQHPAIPTVHISPDTSISTPGISVGHQQPNQTPPSSSSLSSGTELQWSSLELTGVPATLRLIFDLKKQTPSTSQLVETSSERLRRFVEDLLQQPVTASVHSSDIETAIRRAVALACRVCDQQLFLLVDWARQAHFFCHLAVISSSRLSFSETYYVPRPVRDIQFSILNFGTSLNY